MPVEDFDRIKMLEEALVDYIERYGFSEKAREYFLKTSRDLALLQAAKSKRELH
jgi:hypothetical protein